MSESPGRSGTCNSHFRSAGGDGDADEEPERFKDAGVFGGVFEAAVGGVHGRGGELRGGRAAGDQFDDPFDAIEGE